MEKISGSLIKKENPRILPRFRGVFFKTFLGLVLLSVVPIVCIAAMFYNQSVQFWESENYQTNKRALETAINIVDNRLSMVDQDCSILASNELVLTFMLTPSFEEVRRNNTLIKNLMDITGSVSKADLAYVYSNFSGIVLSSEGRGYSYADFFDKPALDAYAQGLWENGAFVRTISFADNSAKKYVTIIKNVPERSVGYLGGVMLNIELEHLFRDINLTGGAMQMSVYDTNKNILFKDSTSDNIVNDADFFETLSQENGAFVRSINGNDYVIIHAISPITRWTYLSCVPLPQFYKESGNITKEILMLSVIMLMVCLVISFIIATNLYHPLKKLMGIVTEPKEGRTAHNEYEFIADAYNGVLQKNSSMSEILNSMRPVVKNNLFLGILTGDEITENEITEKLDFINEGFTSCGYGVLIVHINSFECYDEKCRNLYSYQLMMTLGKAAAQYPYAVIKTDRNQWTLVLNTKEVNNDSILLIASNIWDEIVSEKKISVTIGVGGSYANAIDLAQSYKEAQEVLRFKLYKGVSNEFDILVNNDGTIANGYFLNTKLEDVIINDIRTGDLISLQKSSDDFFENLHNPALHYKDIYIICNHLVDSIVESLISLAIDLKQVFNKQEFDQRFSSSITLDEVQTLIHGLCITAAKQVETHNNEHGCQNIIRMKDFINKHMRNDISLTDLAEHLGLSAAYVSRLFKESLGMGFVEYLNTNRIKRAKILLEETQIMVDQIGFEVGFNNVRSFMRTFKQYEGISPGGYRIEYRQKTAK